MKNMLSFGNRKLPTSTAIFNLPAIKTCPGSTKECRKWCYARKAERLYPQVLPFRKRNLNESKKKTFVINMIEEIRNKKNINQIRIFESGDFYSNKHFNDWCDIAKQFPHKIFYAYTKNNKLDLKYKPNNLILLFSDDNKKYKNPEIKIMGYNGRARVDDGRKLTKREFLCPGSCKECNYCYNGKGFKQVVFKLH